MPRLQNNIILTVKAKRSELWGSADWGCLDDSQRPIPSILDLWINAWLSRPTLVSKLTLSVRLA